MNQAQHQAVVGRALSVLALLASLVAITVLAPATPAQATPTDAKLTGNAILAKLDAAVNNIGSQMMKVEMLIQDKEETPRRLGMQVHVKGQKRHVKFLYPGDVKGMKVLTVSRSQMYVYLPAYRRVRRIASHVRDQSLFGADYSYDDMGAMRYTEMYNGQLLSQTDSHWVVEGKLKDGQESTYARLEMVVRKDQQVPETIRYYDKEGTHIKTETRSDYSCRDGICAPQVMKMVDHTRNDHWTKLIVKEWKPNSTFPDRVFSVRQMQRRG